MLPSGRYTTRDEVTHECTSFSVKRISSGDLAGKVILMHKEPTSGKWRSIAFLNKVGVHFFLRFKSECLEERMQQLRAAIADIQRDPIGARRLYRKLYEPRQLALPEQAE